MKKIWSRISRNAILAGAAGTLIGSGVTQLIGAANAHLTMVSPVAMTERAEIAGGPSGPKRQLYRCAPNGRCVAPDHPTLDSIGQ
jgi:hypothetical protein